MSFLSCKISLLCCCDHYTTPNEIVNNDQKLNRIVILLVQYVEEKTIKYVNCQTGCLSKDVKVIMHKYTQHSE